MKKKVLRTITLSITIFVFYLFINNVNANSISKISMDIYVDNNGDANITEVWDCNVNQGTEVYHPYYNLGESQIKNFKVKEGSREYSNIGTWATSGTLSSKAYKCGINKVTNGVELCFGMSSYGNHVYTLNYTITNFVSELKDAQMIYWTLIPYDFSNIIGKAYVKIHTDFDIENTIDVWGYGDYGGTAYVYDGYIEMASNGRLEKDEYMTILVKFPLGTFNTDSKISKNFDYYYNMAEEDRIHYNEEKENRLNEVKKFLLELALFILIIIVTVVVIVLAIIIKNILLYIISWVSLNINSISKPKIVVKLHDKRAVKTAPYYRDIPCDNDVLKAYFIASQYKLVKNKYDILGAIILKWIKEGRVKLEKRKTEKKFKKEETVFILNNKEKLEDPIEKELFNLLYKAGNNDGILEEKEFKSWFKKHNDRIPSWIKRIETDYLKKFAENGLLRCEIKNASGRFESVKYYPDKSIIEDAIKLSGLKKYLKDYTLIKDREPIEVHLFEQYMIYAQFMGISKKVAKKLKMLYPEIVTQTNLNSFEDISYINIYTHRGIFVSNVGRVRDEFKERAKQYSSGGEGFSSGGGGFSSGGGGGGSFGRPVAAVEVSVKIRILLKSRVSI